MTIQIGSEAPDFELRATSGDTIKLSEFRGSRNVLLVFYPFAFSRVCAGEFCGLRDDNPDIDSESTIVLGVSADPVFALKAWKEAEKYPNEFVSDFWPHGQVAKDYGVFADAIGCARRGTFLIDKQGIVRWMEVTDAARDQSAWRKAIADLEAAG